VSDITNTHQQKNIKKSSSPQPESLLLTSGSSLTGL